MATDVVPAAARTPAPAHRRPAALHAERADFWLAMRQLWLGAVLVTVSTGVLFWLGKTAFDKTQASAGGGIMLGLADNPAYKAGGPRRSAGSSRCTPSAATTCCRSFR